MFRMRLAFVFHNVLHCLRCTVATFGQDLDSAYDDNGLPVTPHSFVRRISDVVPCADCGANL